MKLNKVLKELRDKSGIEEKVYSLMRLTAASRPRLYGLPKPIRKIVLSDPSFPWLTQHNTSSRNICPECYSLFLTDILRFQSLWSICDMESICHDSRKVHLVKTLIHYNNYLYNRLYKTCFSLSVFLHAFFLRPKRSFLETKWLTLAL